MSEAGAVVPSLWRLEVADAFQSALRRKRISPEYRDESLVELGELPITLDADTDTYAWTTTLRLAERYGLTIYDAAGDNLEATVTREQSDLFEIVERDRDITAPRAVDAARI